MVRSSSFKANSAKTSWPIQRPPGCAAARPNLPGYAAFSPAPGHQLGYNELKTLEVHELIMALAGHGQAGTDFEQALEVERLATAIRLAAREQRWVNISEI